MNINDQVSKASQELKRDMEAVMVGQVQAASAGTGSATGPAATARKMGSVLGTDVTGAKIIDAAVTVTNGVPAALSEQNILDVNQKLYTAGSEATVIMVKPADSVIIAGFQKSAGRYKEFQTNDKSVVNVVDLYVSPFGQQKVVINRFIKSDSCLVFDPVNFKQVTLRPWTRELLAKTGDSDRHMIVGEFSIKHVNYSASGLINGLT